MFTGTADWQWIFILGYYFYLFYFGLHGQALDWIHSFVTNRTQSVSFSRTKSIWLAAFCGVRQKASLDRCSIDILCAADFIAIAQRHGFQVHSYADETQLYFHDKAESCERRLPRFTECIAAIESWMTANQLKINTDKTDFIWLGSKHQLAKIQYRSSDISSHLSRGTVWQPPYVHPSRSRHRSSLFLSSSAVTVCDAVADNGFTQDSGARTDSQSSRLLQQCVVSDKHHCHKDPSVSFALSCATNNAEVKVWALNTDTSRWSSLGCQFERR